MACWKTFGISSGRFKIDRVTPVMKYHVFDGRCGYVLKECTRDGVMMDGSIAEDMFKLPGLGISRFHILHTKVPQRVLHEMIKDAMSPE